MSDATVRHFVAPAPRTAGRIVLAVTLAALAALGATQLAAASTRAVNVVRDDAAALGPIEVSVLVGGRWTPLYQASNRPDRWYVEAKKSAKYEVRVRNTTGERLAFVISVDGLNAFNGLRSSLSSSEPMYVLDPWQSMTVRGWRKDMDNVSRFVFVDEQRSYAERTGQGNGDLGWIRVVAFREQHPIAYRQELRFRDQNAPGAPESSKDRKVETREEAQGLKSGVQSQGGEAHVRGDELAVPPAAEPNPGTGWGPNARDRVYWVDFQPETWACAQVIVRYEYRPALMSLGILPWHPPVRNRLDDRENGLYGFAQPPRW